MREVGETWSNRQLALLLSSWGRLAPELTFRCVLMTRPHEAIAATLRGVILTFTTTSDGTKALVTEPRRKCINQVYEVPILHMNGGTVNTGGKVHRGAL